LSIHIAPVSTARTRCAMGGDLHVGGTGAGRFPPKFEVEDGPCICTPNIWRSSVIGCVRKYGLGKKRCNQRLFYQK